MYHKTHGLDCIMVSDWNGGGVELIQKYATLNQMQSLSLSVVTTV